MPGLYKSSKRKRPTMNSTFSNDESVWHSTALESGVLDPSSPRPAGEGEGEGGEDQDEISPSPSPVKRPAMEERGEGSGGSTAGGIIGTQRVVNTPGPARGAAAAAGSDDDDGEEQYGTPSNVVPGPSSASLIRTPAAAGHVDIPVDDDEDEDMFGNMVDDQPAPQRVATSINRREVEEGRLDTRRALDRDVNQSQVRQEDEDSRQQNPRIHLSQRFGPVEIHPSSGHGFFSQIIHKNGFILTFPKNYLYKDAMSFRAEMSKWITNNTDENSRIEDGATRFVKALKKYFAVKANLVHSCTTTLHDKDILQPSLLACLLGVSELQKALLAVVFPALTEASFSVRQEDIDLVSTIVSQMKWLPVLADGKEFAEQILELLENASSSSKNNIIRVLPEIFSKEFHPHLLPKLMALFDRGTVNVTLLDCFSSLALSEDDCSMVRRCIIDFIERAPLEDIPAYFSFLFKVDGGFLHLEEGIRGLREKMVIKQKQNVPKEDALVLEILERIRFFASVNSDLSKIWMREVKTDLSLNVDLSSIDLIMLIVFNEANNKTAYAMLTEVFSKPTLAIELVEKIFEESDHVLHELFPTLARFLDFVLRDRSSKCHEAAAEVVRILFVNLGPLVAQHMMTNLLGVFVSGHPTCRDVVLKILGKIAEKVEDARKLHHFHSYLIGALVYVIKFPPRQMQALMDVLAILAYVPESILKEENAFTAEFMITLRKQITHTNLRIRCFGILGTVVAIKQLVLTADETNEHEAKIDSLLALAWSSIENDEEACSIFFDQIASCINIIPKAVCLEFKSIIEKQIAKLWVLKQNSDSQLLRSSIGQADLELEHAFDANREMTSDRIILILEEQALQMSPLVVPSIFRVLAELHKASCDGDLSECDAFLGCPILFPKFSRYYNQKSLDHLPFNQRSSLGQYLIIAINYFRECVSAFVTTKDPELRLKFWFRLDTLVELHKILVRHFDSFPNLPFAYGTEKSLGNDQTPGFSGGIMPKGNSKKPMKETKKRQPKKKKGKGKAKAKRATDSEGEEQQSEEEEMESNEGSDHQENAIITRNGISNIEEMIQPKNIFEHIRRLDVNVFNTLMKYPLVAEGRQFDFSQLIETLPSRSQSHDFMVQIERFRPETLIFLLSDIKRQTNSKKSDFKILGIEKLLGSLCAHLDTIADYYQFKMASIVTGSEEGVGVEEVCTPGTSTCVCLLINVLDLYFQAIPKLDKTKQREAVSHAIEILAARYRSESQSQDETDNPEASDGLRMANIAKYFGSFSQLIGKHETSTAQDHVKLLKTIHDVLPNQDHMKRIIEDVVKGYLKRDWKLPSAAITALLKTLFEVSLFPLKAVEHFIENLLTADDGDTESIIEALPGASTVYRTCTKLNFHTWYASIWAGLVQHMLKFGRKRGDFEESVELWTRGHMLITDLVKMSKFKKSSILLPLLKYSRIYIDAFITGGCYLMPLLWKRNFARGQEFKKLMSLFSRPLQHVCDHSKMVKDLNLLRQVPPLKKSLEVLLYKSIAGVGTLGVQQKDVFFGMLKHRNLDGEKISSQLPTWNITQAASRTLINDSDSDDDQGEDSGRAASEVGSSDDD